MNHLLPTPDVLGGRSTSSVPGDKTEAGRGSEDFWIVKINSNGQKQWDKTFGGTGDDIGAALVLTPDNGYLLGAGQTQIYRVKKRKIGELEQTTGFSKWMKMEINSGIKQLEV